MKKSLMAVAAVSVVGLAFLAGYFTGRPGVTATSTAGMAGIDSVTGTTNGVTTVGQTNVTTKVNKSAAGANVSEQPVRMAVEKTVYNGQDELKVYLSAKPDMEVARHYVSCDPLTNGVFDVSYREEYDWGLRKKRSVLRIYGDFAFRTETTLNIRAGLPCDLGGNRTNANLVAATTMSDDYSYSFSRKDADPYVKFVAKGRYLPPGGKRCLELESMNVSKVFTEIRRIEPKNLVQMLAREERQYRVMEWRDGSADGEDTEELSHEGITNTIPCINVVNKRETNRFAIDAGDGGPMKGMFLVMVRNGDRKRQDYRWTENYNPAHYRVVCVSDLGLSVRKCGDGLGVWVTSLMTGKPIANAMVEVYSSANVVVAKGTSDIDGWCVPEEVEKGEPFAVVVRSKSGDDMTFLALKDSMLVCEDVECGNRNQYLNENECSAFVWTDRGIYRHDEKIFVHAILRNGRFRAPKPMPVEIELIAPDGKATFNWKSMTDGEGTVACDGFTVPAERPSGEWKFNVKIPGKDGVVLGSRNVKIEEFVPPQVRVKIAAEENQHPTNLAFTINAEHLFGGPASLLACQGAIVHKDVPFAPKGWKGWSFGNETLGLKPNFRELKREALNDKGEFTYFASLVEADGKPSAAVESTFQATVFEDGGRPAYARKSIVTHYYPHYIGSTLGDWVKLPDGEKASVDFAIVGSDGKAVTGAQKLSVKIERVDSVYSYRKLDNGESTWDCNRVKVVVIPHAAVTTDAEGRATYELPLKECGDYVLTVEDGVGCSFAKSFYLSSWGDDNVRAKLSDPTEVTITPDKKIYRIGDVPRLLVKSPFTGWAMMSVMRDGGKYFEILNLTNATSEIVMSPVKYDWTPNVDVYISVVQSVAENAKRLAARAHGQTTIRVIPIEHEIAVDVEAEVIGKKGKKRSAEVNVLVKAPRAKYAVVTLVDEGINLLTDEKTPDPVDNIFAPRCGDHPFFDIFHRVLPVVDDKLRANGVKTGGGGDAGMLSRVSPEPSRRFKPLAMWQQKVAIVDGVGKTSFKLPEFVGEVRVTAVAYSDIATGAASMQRKIAPKVIMQPDAPRFVAPGDEFEVTMPIRNTTKEDGCVDYIVAPVWSATERRTYQTGKISLGGGEMTNVVVKVKASNEPGLMKINFLTRGMNEYHEDTIELPVRPAVAWQETTGIAKVDEEAKLRASVKPGERFSAKQCKVPTDELVGAYRWLADYPYGCLEQTTSRIFPLLSGAMDVVSNREEYIAAGVKRIESMIRQNDFVMWPDCNYAPWDREVSLYAAHFLIEASRLELAVFIDDRVIGFMRKWAGDKSTSVSAYACHNLALSGYADRGRMLTLFDRQRELDALSRARLARAFALDHDFKRAEQLLASAYEPQNIREAAFTVLAMLETNPDDTRVFPIVKWLMEHREPERYSWGTTGDNAHALLAIGDYYREHPGMEKEPYLVWRKLTLPEVAEVKDDSAGIAIDRKFYRSNGEPADLANLKRGEMLFVELTLTTDVNRTVNDLVIEDLFPACFEPIHSSIAMHPAKPSTSQLSTSQLSSWVMRSDARDDRMLVFSKKFDLEKGDGVKFTYPVRVVSAGDFILPGASVEGMYNPRLHSRRAPGRIVVRH